MSADSQESGSDAGRRLVLVAVIYGILNALCVLVPFIPSSATFLLWGFFFPAIGIISIWVGMAKGRRENPNWWMTGSVLSLLYVLMGFLTVRYIVEAWASI